MDAHQLKCAFKPLTSAVRRYQCPSLRTVVRGVRSSQFPAMIEVRWREPGRLVYCRVERELKRRQLFIPMALVLLNKLRHHCLNRPVCTLNGVALRSTGWSKPVSDAVALQQVVEMVRAELRSIVRDNLFRTTMPVQNLVSDDL